MYENQTYEALLLRMLNGVQTPGIAKQEGTFVYDALSPAALELAQAYAQLDRVLRLGFAETAGGKYLDMRAGEMGVVRKAAVAARGTLQVTGLADVTLPVGTAFSTVSGTQFRTVHASEVRAGATVAVQIEAVQGGAAGNVPAGLVTVVPILLSGKVQVTNAIATDGGVDAESDEALLARLLAKARNPATSGNASHYMQWAREMPGIGDVRVFPLWNGPGTVKVALLDDDRTAPDETIVATVAGNIEALRPIGADVTVVGAAELPIHVSAEIVLAPGGALVEVKRAVEDGVRAYLRSLAFRDPYVRYARIAGAILDVPFVQDYANLLVNGSTGNIEVATDSVAVLGTVTLT